MNDNGKPSPTTFEIAITFDRETGKLTLSAPEDHRVAFGMLQRATAMVFQQATTPEPERKVKTLDELGMRSGPRLA